MELRKRQESDDYYAQYEYEDYGRQQPEHGLRLDEPSTASPKYHAFTKPVMMTPPDKAELLAWRGPDQTPVQPEGDGTEEPPAPRDPAVRKLSFTTHLHAQTSVFHTVHGVKRRGLLIDPGAAAGLIGSETLRDLMESCNMKAEDITWTESTASITGISGEPDKALGRVKLKLPFKNMEATFTADVIGKSGSLCPALVGNPALCEMRFSLHSRWFDNGDGLLVTWDVKRSQDAQMHTFRVLLTDSGHYLLPLDVDAEVPEEKKEACHFIRHLSETSHRRWPDHSYVFWQTLLSGDFPVLAAESDVFQNAQISGKFGESGPKFPGKLPLLSAGDSERQWSDLRSNLATGLETDNKQKKTLSFATENEAEKETFTHTTEELTTTKNEDKKETFTYTTEELTTTKNEDKKETFTYTTEETTSTETSASPANPNENHPSQILATNLTDLPLYVEDTLPESLSPEEIKKLQKDYRAMPEEFYTKSNHRVVTPSSSPTPMSTSPSPSPPTPSVSMEVEERVIPFKRDVRDTEPPQGESTPKRFRAEGFVDTKEYQNMHTAYWMIDRSRKFRLHLQELWTDMMKVPKWFSSVTSAMVQQMAQDRHAELQRQCHYLVQFPSMREEQFYFDLAGKGCYVSMTAEDNIAESDLADIWPLVEESDAKEVAQFVDEKAFEPVRLRDAPEGTVIVDGTWVRRWTWKLGKRIVKSRMCARGCFDPQKDFLATRSTTASRLSQRILISTAALMGEDPESWDVSGAFLKGLTFDRIRAILLSQGIKTPIRSVILVPPFNVWRHLAAVDPKFHLEPHMIPEFGLWCLKPIYGLNDAPVAWQLSLGEFLKNQKGTASLLNDSFYFWKDPKQTPSLQGALTTHVDDLAVVGSSSFKKHLYDAMCKQFGQISKDYLPFPHCGCLYSKTETGLKIDQASFAQKLKPAPDPAGSDDRFLKPEEVTQFRSVLGALLWLCSTRLDIISEVGVLQSSVTNAQVKHLRMANQLCKKASAPDRVHLGLHYKFFPKNMKFRIQCIHDAASSTKERSYAQEGILIYMMPELPSEILNQDEISCDDATVAQLCNYGHLLFARC